MANEDVSKKPVGANKPQPRWIDVKTDRLWPEIRLFCRSFTHASWQDRCDQWSTHVNVYQTLSDGAESTPKTTRMRFLNDHLNVLDTKFSVLLTVNTLLLVALNVLLGFLLNKGRINHLSAWFAVLFGSSWLITMAMCLIGERRLVWGDLGLVGKSRLNWNEFKDGEQFNGAEETHVRALIVSVVKRTNKFRVGMLMTYFNVAFLAGEFVATLLIITHV